MRELGSYLFKAIATSIKTFMIVILAIMSVLIVYQVACRYFLNDPSNASDELLRYSLIWMGILGATLCFIVGQHLNLPLVYDKLSPKNQLRAQAFITVMNIALGVIILAGGIIAYGKNYDIITPIMGFRIGALQTVLTISGTIIVLNQVAHLTKFIASRDGSVIVTILLTIAALIAIYYALEAFKNSDSAQDYFYEHVEVISGFVLFIPFLIFLIIGAPIAVGLAISGILTLSLQIDNAELVATAGEKFFTGLDSFGFLALPFFILAGNIMNQGGIARKLINVAMLLGRRIPGSLFQANTVANMLFGSLSGSAVAASTAIGGIVMPMAREEKYDMPMATAVNAMSSICGFLIPPTGCFIVYSLITNGEASIAGLFLGGYVPGFIMGLAVMLVALYFAIKHKYPTDKSKLNLSEATKTIIDATPSLLLIVIVIGGIIIGAFTAIEASGIAVAYSFILALCYKALTFKKLCSILYNSALSSSVILFLIAASGLMSWSMTFAGIPDAIGELLTTISSNKYVILAIINVTLLAVGLFMDMTPAMLIFTPILYPVVTSLGVDPIHFGIILVYNLALGVVTPPVGTVLYVSANVSGEKVTKVLKPLLPLFIAEFIGLFLVTYIPALTMALPNYFGF